MKNLFVLVGFVCLIAMLVPACAPAPEPEPEAAPEPVFDQAAEEAAIREATKQAMETINKGDVKAHVALYAYPNVNFQTTRDRAAHEKAHMEDIAKGSQGHQEMLAEIGIVFLTPDVAIHKHRVEFTGGLDEDGKPLPPSKAIVARVYVKKDGKWLTQAYFMQPTEE